MRFAVAALCAVAAFVLVLGSGAFQAAQEEKKAKLTIKQVMKEAHVGGEKSLLKKVGSGKATEAEKAKLVTLYVALSKNEPPKGDIDDWKMRTGKMVELAKKAEKGDETNAKALVEAVVCAACHKLHKGK
jgi:hypothetical protein